MFVPYTVTEDGFETQLAINYFGHFMLSSLLLKAIKNASCESEPSRIVNLSSAAHFAVGSTDIQDLDFK